MEPRIKLGLESPWGGKTLCLSHLWASHHGIDAYQAAVSVDERTA